MVREQLETKPYKYKPITLTNRHKRYVQSHINNQQRIRNFANGFPEVIDTTHLLLYNSQPQHTATGHKPIATTTDKPLTDEQGLQRAYNANNRLYLQGDTLYIAGTTWRNPYTGNLSLQDAWDDLKIPFGLTRFAERYKTADEVMKAHLDIERVVGHSLGGSTALELQKRYDVKTTTYGAPVWDLTSALGSQTNQPVERYRHPLDPISFFDGGAKSKMTLNLNPHTYSYVSTEKKAA